MTLSPSESRDVRGVTATRYRLPKLCSHPFCHTGGENIEAHHLYRRSQIVGDSWFVSIEGGDPIPHVVGLCPDHHRQVTDNQAWIKNEHGMFIWYDENGTNDDGTKHWDVVGSLSPQPAAQVKQVQHTEQKPAKPKTEKSERRPSQVLSIRCPKDAADVYGEDGIALLKELIAECGRVMPHREADSPPYFLLMDALGWFVLSYRPGEDG